MLKLRGEFRPVHLGGGPKGDGVYWVDDDGRWNKFDPGLPNNALNQNFDLTVRDRQIAFVLMGMARVQVNVLTKHVDVRWNVRAVSPATLDAVSGYLSVFFRNYAVRLCFYIDAWNYETYRTATAAVERIQSSKSYKAIKLVDSCFLTSAKLDDVDNLTALLRKGWGVCQRTKGDLTHPDFQSLIPYLIVYKPYEVEDQLIVANAGHQSGYAKVYGRAWAERANGLRYDNETPGNYYSQRVSEAYSGVIMSGEPRLDHIRAVIKRPGDEPMWTSYQRILFRGNIHGGAPVLVCLSDLTDKIDIPFLGHRQIN